MISLLGFGQIPDKTHLMFNDINTLFSVLNDDAYVDELVLFQFLLVVFISLLHFVCFR